MLPGYRKPRLSVDVNEAVAPPSSYVPTGRMDGAHQKQGHLSISVFRYVRALYPFPESPC